MGGPLSMVQQPPPVVQPQSKVQPPPVGGSRPQLSQPTAPVSRDPRKSAATAAVAGSNLMGSSDANRMRTARAEAVAGGKLIGSGDVNRLGRLDAPWLGESRAAAAAALAKVAATAAGRTAVPAVNGAGGGAAPVKGGLASQVAAASGPSTVSPLQPPPAAPQLGAAAILASGRDGPSALASREKLPVPDVGGGAGSAGSSPMVRTTPPPAAAPPPGAAGVSSIVKRPVRSPLPAGPLLSARSPLPTATLSARLPAATPPADFIDLAADSDDEDMQQALWQSISEQGSAGRHGGGT